MSKYILLFLLFLPLSVNALNVTGGFPTLNPDDANKNKICLTKLIKLHKNDLYAKEIVITLLFTNNPCNVLEVVK